MLVNLVDKLAFVYLIIFRLSSYFYSRTPDVYFVFLAGKNHSSSSSSAESDTNHVQVSLNRSQPCETTVSSAQQLTDIANSGNRIEKNQVKSFVA